MPRRDIQIIAKPLIFLISTLIIGPLLFTYTISYHVIQKQSLCMVGPPSNEGSWIMPRSVNDSRGIYGMYQRQNTGKKSFQYIQVVKSTYRKQDDSFLVSLWKGSWPSMFSLSFEALAPLSFRRLQSNQNAFVFQKDKSNFCLQGKSPEYSFCSNNDHQSQGDLESLMPLSGFWNTDEEQIFLEIKCHKPPSNQQKKKKQKKTLNHIIYRPATTILLVINSYLAYYYWNYHISPSDVSIVYNKIIQQENRQLWRIFSGTFAHFEVLHIGFNMMSLYSLGIVEDLYGSISYLYASLSMCFYTVGFMLLGTCSVRILSVLVFDKDVIILITNQVFYVQAKHFNDVRMLERQTVGYSGILFVWMVIATLEQGKSCPIPVLSDLCFETWSIGPFQFNVAPIAQLIFIQAFMKRASFVGHLGGIICGYLMHWGILPRILLDPTVVIPLLTLIYLWKVIQRKPDDLIDENDNLGEEAYQFKKKTLCRTQSAITGVVTLSLFAFDTIAIVQQFCIAILYFNGIQFQKTHSISQKETINIILIGFIMSATLVIINDAGSIGLWFSLCTYVNSCTFLPFTLISFFAFLRLCANIVALSVAAYLISPLDGFVKILFGKIVENAQVIGKEIVVNPESVIPFQAFQGVGRSLRQAHANR